MFFLYHIYKRLSPTCMRESLLYFGKKGVNMAEKYVVCCSNKKRSYFVV